MPLQPPPPQLAFPPLTAPREATMGKLCRVGVMYDLSFLSTISAQDIFICYSEIPVTFPLSESGFFLFLNDSKPRRNSK